MKTFKKFIFGFAFIFGLMLAITVSAFKTVSHSKLDDPITFEYTPPGSALEPYSDQNVQDLDNWHATDVATNCDDINVKACSIVVPDVVDYVDHSGATLKLQDGFSIQTSGTSVAYVTGTDADNEIGADIINRSN